MTILSKELSLYDRNGEGDLIPKKVTLQLSDKDSSDYPELANQEISIIPITRGEIKELFGVDSPEDINSAKDGDAELIVKNCKNPAFTKEDIVFAKPVIIRSIVKTILNESGVKILSSGQKKIDTDTDDFGKNC